MSRFRLYRIVRGGLWEGWYDEMGRRTRWHRVERPTLLTRTLGAHLDAIEYHVWRWRHE